jgi:ferredoxin
MTITNGTKNETFYYQVACDGVGACGTLAPEGEAVLPHYDNKKNVKVTLTLYQTGDETEVVVADPGL